MRTIVFLGLLLMPFLKIHAQGFRQNVVVESIDQVCMGNQSEAADAEAEAIVDEMMGQMGLNRSFTLRKCANIGNALAHIEEDENGNLTPYILYDPQWLAQMSKKSNTDWASIGVLAHEVGHFLLYHSLNNQGSSPRLEISADRFAGTTLARMGSTLEEAQSMFKNYPEKASSSHPGKADRMEAIKVGWMKFNNPTQKNILLNENTAERDITHELIINKHYKEAGGLKALSQIKKLSFTEQISETRGENLRQEPLIYSLGYDQDPNLLLIKEEDTGKGYYSEYMIKNDSLFNKYSDEKVWKNGAPRIGTSAQHDDYKFKRDKRPSTYSFFDDFVLISNPEISTYEGRKRIGGEECFELELPKETMEIGNLNKKGKRITTEKNYYYNTSTGLLHAIIERETTTIFKKGNPKGNATTVQIEHIFESYTEVKDILFPAKISTSVIPVRYDVLKTDEGIFQKRKLINLTFL
ncbi:hypothetical protein ACFQZJ_00975 [Maribacter chungangensis]|uniref:Peptidase M48 domain-containing protein n=1 Tax=Maribacter chungangensis TaxID=1069117 RepID=A0ABW3AY95_9FLAO